MTTARPAYPPQGQWTLEAFDALREDKVKRELVDGELLVSPTGTWPHNTLGAQLAVRLQANAPPRYVVLYDNEILISPTHVRRPDLMVVTATSAEREDGTLRRRDQGGPPVVDRATNLGDHSTPPSLSPGHAAATGMTGTDEELDRIRDSESRG